MIRVGASFSQDDGAGAGTGRPDVVQPDQDREYRRQLYSLEVFHQFSEKFGAGAIIPCFRLHLEDLATQTEGDSSGFGDLRLYAIWSPWEDEKPNDFFDLANLNFIFGLTIPTASDVLPDLPVGRDGQLGGGSLDVRLGVSYWGNLSEKWALFGAFNLLVDTGDDYLGYRNSPSFSGRLGGGFTPIRQVSIYAAFRITHSRANLDPAGEVPNTGGTFAYFEPSVVVRPTDWLWLDASASLPIYHDVIGEQVLPGFTFTIGVSFLIKEGEEK